MRRVVWIDWIFGGRNENEICVGPSGQFDETLPDLRKNVATTLNHERALCRARRRLDLRILWRRMQRYSLNSNQIESQQCKQDRSA